VKAWDFVQRLNRMVEDGTLDLEADVFMYTDTLTAHPIVAIDAVNRNHAQLPLSGSATLCFVRLR